MGTYTLPSLRLSESMHFVLYISQFSPCPMFHFSGCLGGSKNNFGPVVVQEEEAAAIWGEFGKKSLKWKLGVPFQAFN